MLQDHGKDVAAFERESNAGKDTDVRNFATQTLPTLQDHLKDANKIAQKVLQERTVSQPSAASLR
jgi:putative membrane protein